MSAAPDASALDALLRQPGLGTLLALLHRDGEEARVVGGAVRNALLGRPVTEIDLATTATPDTVIARAAAAHLKAVPTGIDHGTVTVVVHGIPFEVTTLREDVETFGRHALVRFGRSFAADARRRDFTINAFSLGADGRLHDYVGGLADLRAGRVRFIGDADARIREDYLRILRFFRFHAEYGEGDPDETGLLAAIRGRTGLALLSRERVRTEVLKLLAARRAVEGAALLSETGFLTALTGGIGWIGRLARVAAREAASAREADAVRRLAAFCVSVPEDAERLRDRLRLSNAEHDQLAAFGHALAFLKSRDPPLDRAGARRALAEFGEAAVESAVFALEGEPRPVVTDEGRDVLGRLANGEERPPAFPLRGADFLTRGVAAGPRLGALLARARRGWLEEGCPESEDAKRRLVEGALAAERPEGLEQAQAEPDGPSPLSRLDPPEASFTKGRP